MPNGRIKTLFVIHSPVFGGPHNTIAVINLALQASRIDTIVVLPEGADEAATRLRDAGLEVVMMPLHRARAVLDPRIHVRWLRSLRAEINSLAELIEQRNVQVVIATSLPNVHSGLAARKAGVALVWQLLDSYSPLIFRRLFMPFVLAVSDVIMSTGQQIGVQHPGVTKIANRWIPFFPAVDSERFDYNEDTRDAARRELGLPTDALVVGNVSNINPMKGHRTFIRAAAKLRITHPDVRFAILGQIYSNHSEYYESLLTEAESLGLVVGKDLVITSPGLRVHELIQAFDIFWMTSEPRSEGVPTVIGEAKATGLPVVTTDVGSTSECVTNGQSGYVVEPLRPDLIAAATSKMIDDPALFKSFRLQARSEAVRDYAAARGAERHAAAYRLAIEHRARARTSLRRPLRTPT